jgi:hypothetical protein
MVQADLADDLRHHAALDAGETRQVFRPERRRGEPAVAITEGERGEPPSGGVAVLDLHDEQRVLHLHTHGQPLQIGSCGDRGLGYHGGSGCFTSGFGCSLKT